VFRFRVLAALTTLAAFLLVGVGSAQADNYATAQHHANGPAAGGTGNGHLIGAGHGSANGSQGAATGFGGGSRGDTADFFGQPAAGALPGTGSRPEDIRYPFAPY
jgi:hypothetical protein